MLPMHLFYFYLDQTYDLINLSINISYYIVPQILFIINVMFKNYLCYNKRYEVKT